ncbi:exodeoxyribonuclease V subunit gamma [Frateuria aurantia]|uniref:RecBCD enzyme subunit RecC n=1 Tax=Frateuria aurantia (strain ATCC 33424 / DSM 6220 / KCTC 2777 / LMG 1558 / NBRC 3245 / NCIMB 13370) TaxID=767434 RepID=H8L504_FRAAD|nr:exodeoxyribonuclease V subunit gamma [Frateuria aurantia]AFC85718.1 exodeoxyribonuclease V, gamma subunit [Frateuria aurantia DSM 6220]
MTTAAALTPGLMVIHGNQIEDLRELCVAWMRRHPLRPLENERFLVYSNGIAQWLKQALAEDAGCGIAAALQFDLPSRFMWSAYRLVLGEAAIPTQSPLDKAPLTWRLLRLLPECLHQEVFAPLRHFLADDPDLRKRHQLAERLADLFDQYQVYRADWLNDWAAGRDELRSLRHGAIPLQPQQLWQPALWRALLADINDPELVQGRAFVHPRFVAALETMEQPPVGLPRRIIVFGITSLPAQALEALAAMARFSQVILCVHNPCQHHWGDIVEDKDLLRHQYRRHPHRPGQIIGAELLHAQAQPLLAAWGKQGRDYINLLDRHDDPERYREHFERIDVFEPPASDHLLGQLQDDIFDLRPLRESRELWPAVDPARDHSIRFHVAHSAQREVEILHDQLLAAFSADPALRPRDIIVMVPDIQTYAPAIQAVFGQYPRGDARHIPFTIADQGVRGQSPLTIALEQLLQLPRGRLAVSDVLDLLDAAPLRQRFGIAEQDLPQLRQWLDGAGIRWGLDAGQRAALGQRAGLEQNTWDFGLRRLLLGYASAEEAFAGIEPYADIGGLDAALLGPLIDLLQALRQPLQQLAEAHAPAAWGMIFRQLLEQFLRPVDEQDQALVDQLLKALDDWLDLCRDAGLEDALPLSVAREGWLATLDQGGLSQRFLSGAVNFCTLLPMRTIPFRQVCLLGMNDGDYPRSKTPMDFDLMAGDYRPGDRSRRDDDRYLLLEALLSARDRLHVSWVGRSIRDDSERPASVLVGQLRDHLVSGWRLAGGGDLLQALTTIHPLQAFSRRYFEADTAWYTHAGEWAAVHQTPTEDARSAPSLPAWQDPPPLSLDRLQAFLADPVRAFFQQRLGIHLDQYGEELQDDEHFGLDGLQRYSLTQALLDETRQQLDLQGAELAPALALAAQRLQGRGQLPLAGFGAALRDELLDPLPDQFQRYRQQRERWSRPLAATLPLQFVHGTLRLDDWLGGLCRDADDQPASLQLLPRRLLNKKALNWHRLLKAFVTHAAACASGIGLHTVLIAEDVSVSWAPLPQPTAETILADWLDGWAQGMCQPLPTARKTALSWLAHAEEDLSRAWKEAARTYQDDFTHGGEVRHSASLARQYPDFAQLVAEPEAFARWAKQLYRPLLQHPPTLLDADSP